jgi:hypothetical protein
MIMYRRLHSEKQHKLFIVKACGNLAPWPFYHSYFETIVLYVI